MTDTIAAFRALHTSGCFVIPNPWDVGSARFLAHLGFRALATTSAGFGFTRGRPDRVSSLSCDEVIAHARDIAAATPLPVSADFQHGYADAPEAVLENVARCAATGIAGLSIEDATGNPSQPLYERTLAVERIRAARTALGEGVLTARCEAWLVQDPDPFRTAIDRLVAYADAGADCLFAPAVRDPKQIAAVVRAVAPKPVNVIVTSPGLTVPQLADLGVRRISVGSALARVAWGAFARAARRIQADGTFDELASAMPFAELDALFR